MNLMCFFFFYGQNNSASCDHVPGAQSAPTDFAREVPMQTTAPVGFARSCLGCRIRVLMVAVIASCKGWEALVLSGRETEGINYQSSWLVRMTKGGSRRDSAMRRWANQVSPAD